MSGRMESIGGPPPPPYACDPSTPREAEQLPVKDDKELELEIVKNLRKLCVESRKSISLAMEAFPLSHWPPQRWQEYESLWSYCRDNGVRIVVCGTPLKVIRTVRSKGQLM